MWFLPLKFPYVSFSLSSSYFLYFVQASHPSCSCSSRLPAVNNHLSTFLTLHHLSWFFLARQTSNSFLSLNTHLFTVCLLHYDLVSHCPGVLALVTLPPTTNVLHAFRVCTLHSTLVSCFWPISPTPLPIFRFISVLNTPKPFTLQPCPNPSQAWSSTFLQVVCKFSLPTSTSAYIKKLAIVWLESRRTFLSAPAREILQSPDQTHLPAAVQSWPVKSWNWETCPTFTNYVHASFRHFSQLVTAHFTAVTVQKLSFSTNNNTWLTFCF